MAAEADNTEVAAVGDGSWCRGILGRQQGRVLSAAAAAVLGVAVAAMELRAAAAFRATPRRAVLANLAICSIYQTNL